MKSFNQDQITNLIQTVGKIGGASLGTYSVTTQNAWGTGVGFAIAFVSWWFSHHGNATPVVPPGTTIATSTETVSPPAPPAPPTVLTAASVVSLIALCLGVIAASGCAAFDKLVDPALPGQTKPAPFLAFTNGSAYLLGHAVSSNEFYSATLDASKFGTGLLIKAAPSATNYLGDAQVVFQSAADSGVYNAGELQTGLSLIPLKNPGDQPLLDSVVSSGLSLAGVYLSPLLTGGTNAGPYINAGLQGIADGL